jgi:hypothetical protein
MAKYFGKLLKIKFYILYYPSHGNMKKMSFWGMWISFEIHWISLLKIYFII